jgi:hypothetical protein
MAKNELTFQQEWMKDARNQGCHAVRVADMYKIGTVDMYVKAGGKRGKWIENKYSRSMNRDMNISPMQRQFLKKEQRAGGDAGWMCCVEIEPSKRWEIWVGDNPDAKYAHEGMFIGTRMRGDKWPVLRCLEVLEILNYNRRQEDGSSD